MTEKRAMIYHIVPEGDFGSRLNGAAYVPSGLAEIGFVHCSLESSVIRVANDYFAGVAGRVLVLEIEPTRLGSEVRYEPASPLAAAGTSHLEGEAVFPHVYGPIDADAIMGVGVLGRTQGGFEWPRAFTSLDGFILPGC